MDAGEEEGSGEGRGEEERKGKEGLFVEGREVVVKGAARLGEVGEVLGREAELRIGRVVDEDEGDGDDE